VIVGLVYFKQDGLIYLPMSTLVTTPAEQGMDYEDVSLTTLDGVRLHAWFVPAPEPRGVLLFFHGNAGNISHRMASIRIFRELGLSVFIIDYRGYGQSEGRPSETGLRQDARAAWDWLRETRQVPAGEIVVFGRSLGADVAAALVVGLPGDEAPGGVILESAFTSAADLGAEIYPWLPVRRLISHRHGVIDVLPELRTPLLIAHSRHDEIVSFDHARRLMAVAHDGVVLLEMEGGHNDGFLRTGQRYVRGLGDFLDEQVFPGPPS